jgi:hypothetical protein
MKKRYRILLAAVAVVLLAVIGTWLYVFRTDRIDVSRVKPDYTLDAGILYQEFEKGEAEATAKYAGKILEIKGAVESVEWNEWGGASLVFVDPMFGVTCTIDSLQAVKQADEIKALKKGDTVKVKGRCDGMLTDVKLVKCALMGK